MITYTFLQQYWWLLVSLLGGLLVFLMFVQGANSLIFSLTNDETERTMIVNSTGRKWEFTFTTLVTFGGAFFASFPLFYSTSFGGAYWVWMLILVSFVLQAVAYEYQSKPGNVMGRNLYRRFLVFNGFVGPFVVGAAVGTFFTGSAFTVNHAAMGAGEEFAASPVISQWANAWHGLDALANVWNLVLGFAVFFLARVLGSLYMLNNLHDDVLQKRLRRQVVMDVVPFLLCFLAFVGYVLTATGLVFDPSTQTFAAEEYKYLHNFLSLPCVSIIFLLGVVLVLFGIGRTLLRPNATGGIWPAGIGTVLTVMALLLVAGLNNTAYYPSSVDPQSSLCLANSCSSEFTLRTMSCVSLLIPFVLAYIAYAWYAIDRGGISREEMEKPGHKY
ncbi:cytochrome d ubiquinol oxidase subunit II [bacterium]|nr:cytochrome d ubiquinol oxidase subunit II [bacterium]